MVWLDGLVHWLPKWVLAHAQIQKRKKPLMKYALFWTLHICLGGCGAMSTESIYEGIRSQQKINADPNIPNPQILPPYDQYQKERDKSK